MLPEARQKRVLAVSSVGIMCNLALFSVKLYIGLAVNSISIFSDGINNLGDSLSCVLAVACMAFALKNQRQGNGNVNAKLEQVLSFLLSLVVLFVGAYFFYSSVERLMYPTPIWYSRLYFWVIAGTVAVKVFMSVFFHVNFKSTRSSTLRVMRTDSILDCGVTSVTLVSFILTKYTQFTVDAFAGIAISIFIVVEAALLVRSSLFGLLNYVRKETREKLRAALEEAGKVKSIEYSVTEEEKINCFVEFENEPDNEKIGKIADECGVKIYKISS